MVRYSKVAFKVVVAAQLYSIANVKHKLKHSQKLVSLKKKPGTRLGCPTIPRTRKWMAAIHRELGPGYFRRAFRMSFLTFKIFYHRLKGDLRKVMEDTDRTNCPNGRIPLTSRIGMAIRYLAGGCPYDISIVFGVSHSDVHKSVGFFIDAVNASENFKIKFPTDHSKQREIAQRFKELSEAEFDCCAGAVDGMLVWTHAPTLEDTIELGVGASKFYCPRKGKFGLNLQAICDDQYRFLDLSILYGGSSSDIVAFEASSIRSILEQPGFLAEGLCLFGDNAYVNRPCMATPFPNVSGFTKQKDAYNFYHSQVRIRIECAFGILCQRFGFLRQKAPKNYSVKKTIATVNCLCKVHNFLIDMNPVNARTVPPSSYEDEFNMAINGAVPITPRDGTNFSVAGQLMGAGEHFDDDPNRALRRRVSRRYNADCLPRTNMLIHINQQDLRRPVRSSLRII